MSIALGCMRLSTAERPPRAQALATIHAALDGGVRLLDTANVYGEDGADLGHNERLICEALQTWSGPSDQVEVATKGGLTRPKAGRWVPDGRGKHLLCAAPASREALGVEVIDTYQLHAPDPKTKLSTSVRALAKLAKQGVVAQIGLCNVRVHEIEAAMKLAPIHSIQVGVSVFESAAIRGGVVSFARDNGLRLLAHSPFGGTRYRHRVRKDPALRQVADRHGVSPHQVALAWLLALGVTPLIGATRPESVLDSLAASELVLTDADWAVLDTAFPAGRVARTPMEVRRPDAGAEGDVVVMMGCPAAGKSSRSDALVEQGYARLNRDEEGGTLAGLVPKLSALLASGRRRVVLDNTYPDRAGRNAVIEAAWAFGVPVRCVWLATSEEQARVNASLRMVARHGWMLGPDEIKAAGKTWANTFGPSALMRYRRALEEPRTDEGFDSVERVEFVRRPAESSGAAVLVHADCLWASAAGKKRPLNVEDLVLDVERIRKLVEQPKVVVLHRDGDRSEAEVTALFEQLRKALPEAGTYWCGHPSGAPVCWCRKPYPGLAVQAVVEHQLDPVACTMVGEGRADQAVATALSMPFESAETFFTRA